MKLSLVVDNILYKECCRNKKCKNCKFYVKEYNCNIAKEYNCNIAYVIKILKKYNEVYSCEENNKNQ